MMILKALAQKSGGRGRTGFEKSVNKTVGYNRRSTAANTRRNQAIAEQFKSNAYTTKGTRRKRGAGAVK